MRALLLALMLLLLMPLQATPMSCSVTGSERSQIRRAFADSTVVFSGYVLEGIVPSAGTALLVYAPNGSPYFLHACSRTMDLDAATGDIPLLNDLSRIPRYRLGR